MSKPNFSAVGARLPRARQAVRAILVLACCASLARAQPPAFEPASGAQLAQAVEAVAGASREEAAAARRFYAAGGDVPAWVSPAAVQAALALLDGAAGEGLEPGDYGHEALRALLDGSDRDGPAAIRFDAALTLAMLRYVADLHGGRTRGTVPSYAPVLPDPFDAGATLRAALADRRIAELPAAAAPALAVYSRLRAALREYRDKAARGDTMVGKAAGPALEAGAATAALRRRLAELGDLAPGTPERAQDLEDALKRFQRRHGLREDGIAGPATTAALDVPSSQRAGQIALAMERLRWLPPLLGGRVVAINLPSYRLWAFDRAGHGTEPVLDMRVIVGKAVRTPTPVFVGMMRYVEFNPYWNVPASIVQGEIVPRLARDAGYLGRHHMEIVGVGTRVEAATLQRLRAGTARLRQLPGPDNALGPVKFGLPNPMNIYLHGTPARELFGAARRDFSHGCIRVESPAALAVFVLGEHGAWNAEAVAAAMAPGQTRVVQLATPLPVVIFYATAIAQADGTMSFLDDMYGLDAALRRRWSRPPLQP